MDCGCNQLVACLARIATEKRRNVRGACCEYISHFIILSILVLGYLQSQITTFPAELYTKLNIQITPQNDLIEVYSTALNGPLVVPDLNQYLLLGRAVSTIFGGYSSLAVATGFADSYTNLLFPGDLHFAPNNELTRSLVSYINSSYPLVQDLNFYIHDSEKEGVNYILDNLENPALAFIVLREVSLKKVNYVIRQNYTTLPNTNEFVLSPAIGLQKEYQQYFLSGYLSIQQAVDNWIFEYSNFTQVNDPICQAPPYPTLAPYPTYAYDQNLFYSAVGFLLGLAMVMSTMYPMSKLTKSIVEEKETRMRELMKIMGLKDWVHGLSWFLSGFILFFWIALTSTWITTGTFIISSNGFLIFLYFFFFCMSEINFAFLVSVFFGNAKLAAIFAPVILFSTILPRYLFYTSNANENVVYKVLACFLSPTAFAFGADIIANYEYSGVGVQFENISSGDFNFGTVLLMLWLDFYIYGFLAWYLDKIVPHEMGTAKHPLFIFSSKYWCSCFWDQDGGREMVDGAWNDLPEFNDENCGANSGLELIPESQRNQMRVRIKDLGKRYSDGKVAVKNLSMGLMEGQITCLLGHNGSGETNSIS
jgi:ATP-binding cassette subfamily A (ABC1) protein 3